MFTLLQSSPGVKRKGMIPRFPLYPWWGAPVPYLLGHVRASLACGQLGPHTEQGMLTLAPASNGFGAPGGDPVWTGKNDVPFPGTLWSAGITKVALVGAGVPQLPLSLWTAHASWCSTKCQASPQHRCEPTCPGHTCHVSLGPAVHSCCVFRGTPACFRLTHSGGRTAL